MIALAALAGGLHIVMMQALAVGSAAVFAGFHPELQSLPYRRRPRMMPILVTAITGVTAFCASAIQLLSSVEYSAQAIRFLGNFGATPAAKQIPYAQLFDHHLYPQAIVTLIFPFALPGNAGQGEVISAYIGVLPLLAAIIGIWRCWSVRWVQYLAMLAVCAFVYSLGNFSFLHGVMYAVIPRLWMAREASRFVYLLDFALCLLAGFGTQALMEARLDERAWNTLTRVFSGLAILCAGVLIVPALFNQPMLHPWIAFSLLMILAVYLVLNVVVRGHSGPGAHAVIIALIVFDLGSFDWSARDKSEVKRTGTDQLERALSVRGAIEFIKVQPGLARVDVMSDPKPNIGDLFRVQTLNGGGVTLLTSFATLRDRPELLNARYKLKPASSSEPGAIYQDGSWKVYVDPQAFPRAWLVHQTLIEPSAKTLREQLGAVDLHNIALLQAPLPEALEPVSGAAPEQADVLSYGENSFTLQVNAQRKALLVVSEIFDPGWKASVDGSSAPILKVDGGLRGVIVPQGRSTVVFRYLPWSYAAGATLSAATWLGAIAIGTMLWRKRRGATGREEEEATVMRA
jgi:hypothetical protein